MAEVKWWASEPPAVRAPEPVRQYGYALIYIHDMRLRPTRRGQPPQLEVEYAVVQARLFPELLPAPVEQAMFSRWMMQYRMPFTVNMDDGWTINFF